MDKKNKLVLEIDDKKIIFFETPKETLNYEFESFYNSSLSEDNIYNYANKYLEKRNVVTCGTIEIEEGQAFPIKGIEGNHEYLVTNKEIINEVKILRKGTGYGFG